MLPPAMRGWFADRGWRLLAALASGGMLILAGDLEPWWAVAWVAPLPLLVAAFRAPAGEARVLAAGAGLVAAAGVTGYRAEITGPAVTLGLALLTGLAWMLVVAGARAAMLGSRHWLTGFAYPVLWAAVDTLVGALSPHGTAGSLAYSQMDALPVIQVASVAGTAGVVFAVSLFPSVLAVAWCRRGDIDRPWLAYGVPAVVLVSVLAFGVGRLAAAPQAPTIGVGLAAVDRPRTAGAGGDPWDAYLQAVARMAEDGARVVVLPEKIAPLDVGAAARVRVRLADAARSRQLYLVAGVTVLAGGHRENRAWLFGPDGALVADYAKQHLIPGLERDFVPGRELVVRRVADREMAVAICKDMDFAPLGRGYGGRGAVAVLVPAWDFERDAWLHARMATLRGVESGYTVIRAARQGLLSVTDRYGRVIGEAPSGSAPVARLVVAAPLGPGQPTPYARVGDVFGWLCLAGGLAAWGWSRWTG
jgi:apolipoprotein N-acyltransferase